MDESAALPSTQNTLPLEIYVIWNSTSCKVVPINWRLACTLSGEVLDVNDSYQRTTSMGTHWSGLRDFRSRVQG